MRLAALALDDYLLAVAPQSDNWRNWSYWYIPDPEPGDEYVIYEVERDVPRVVADELLLHGTREQTYADGYEAMGVIEKYGLKELDRWLVEDEDEIGEDLEEDLRGEDEED